MARFFCCTVQAEGGDGEYVWINFDHVKLIKAGPGGVGSKITFLDAEASLLHIEQDPDQLSATLALNA